MIKTLVYFIHDFNINFVYHFEKNVDFYITFDFLYMIFNEFYQYKYQYYINSIKIEIDFKSWFKCLI